MKIKENISLARYTTFKIGGPARYFFVAKTKEDLIKAVKEAKERKISFFILGGGSNILFSDKGFSGLVIKLEFRNYELEGSNLYAEAGTKLKDLVKLSGEGSLTGLEWAAGVPGTVGGAIYGNAQAFDAKMSDMIKSVEIFDTKNLKIKNLSKKQCCFSKKESIFKRNKDLIIISAILKLKKGSKREIQKRIKEHFDYRKKNHPLSFFSAGSIFVNKPGKPPSSYLIEKCGLKGTKIGDAQISEKHAGFIVNLGGAKAKDVIALIKLVKEKVKKKFGIDLEEEIRIIK